MGWRRHLVLVVAVGAAACGRVGFGESPCAGAACPDACVGEACGTIVDAAATDATPTNSDAGIDGAVGGPSGSFTLSAPASYTCAAGLLDIAVTIFTFADNGTTLTVTSDDPGAIPQPCTMTGASVAGGNFDVMCTLAGGCDEVYRLAGSFTDPDSWMGTFSVNFVGSCLNCTLQSFAVTGSR